MARALDHPPSMAEPLDAYLDRLAAGTPTPGGGAAAAVTGALAAALCAMAGRVTARRGDDATVMALVHAADEERRGLRRLAARDEEAYGAVIQARRAGRSAAEVGEALRTAAAVPLDIVRASVRVLETAYGLARVAAGTVASDVAVAAELAAAALVAAAGTARANLDGIRDREEAHRIDAELDGLTARGERLLNDVRARLPHG